MATRSQIILDPIRNIVIASGSGAPPSDFLPGIGSLYTDYTTGAGYTLGSSGWTALAAGGSYLALSGGTLTGALLGTTGSFSSTVTASAFVQTGTAAAFGAVKLANNTSVNWRNAANSADISIGVDSNNFVQLGVNAAAVISVGAYFQVKAPLYAGDAATARTYGDINARRSSTQGYIYFGDGTDSLIWFSGTSYFLGHNGSSASLGVQGQIRATGWFQSGDLTGFGCEIGVSGSTAFMIAFDRSTSEFGPLGLEGDTLAITTTGGANPTCNSKIMATIQIGTTIPGTTPADGDLFALTS